MTLQLIDDNKAPLTDEENEAIIELTHKHFRIPSTDQARATNPQ